MSARLHVAPRAYADLAEIKDYIAETLCNPEAADRLLRGIVEKYELLPEFPLMGAELASIMDSKSAERYLLYENYIIIYEHKDDTVFVLRVLYAKRDYARILFNQIQSEEE